MSDDDEFRKRFTPPASAEDGGEGALMAGIPHAREIGMRIVHTEPDVAVLSIPYDPRLVGDPETGVLHGGAVTTLLDTCCGAAVMVSRKKPLSTATLDLRINYMRPATPGRAVFARAHCYRATRNVGFVRAVAYHDDPETPVATASAAFMLEFAARARGRD